MFTAGSRKPAPARVTIRLANSDLDFNVSLKMPIEKDTVIEDPMMKT
jgi:hypothetical protein